MCTVTVVPYDRGLSVVCNRDERLTRPAALAPCRHRVGSRTAVFPLDGDGGGTWIGANDTGLVVALLNRHANRDRDRFGKSPVSRGLIVPMLLACPRLDDLLAAAWTIDRRRFQPFRLMAVQGLRAAFITAGPQAWPVTTSALRGPFMMTSSSLGDAYVDVPRRQLFRRFMTDGAADRLDAQRRYHRHCWPRRPDVSVMMSRSNARTVSRTVVDVTPGTVAMDYKAFDVSPSRGPV